MLASHYAPRATAAAQCERSSELAKPCSASAAAPDAALNLSLSGDLVEAAANLFSHLRALDAKGAKVIAVMPIPREGLGEAINDRLERAAAPRLSGREQKNERPAQAHSLA